VDNFIFILLINWLLTNNRFHKGFVNCALSVYELWITLMSIFTYSLLIET